MKVAKLFFVLFFISHFLSNCKEKIADIKFEKFKIEKKIIPDSISKRLAQYGLNNTVISKQSLDIGLRNYPFVNEDYICKASIDENDTLSIWINNYNGYYGNGILINVFNDNFNIKSVDPSVIKGIKFENYNAVKQSLILNQTKFKKGDSVFGKIEFECVVDSLKYKKMEGYFKAEIQ